MCAAVTPQNLQFNFSSVPVVNDPVTDALNGDLFVHCASGEPQLPPVREAYQFPELDKRDPAFMKHFLLMNAGFLLTPVAGNVPNPHGWMPPNPQEALKIAYLRYSAVRLNLVSPSFEPRTFHCKYKEAEEIKDYESRYPIREQRKIVTDYMKSENFLKWVGEVGINVVNVICLVAFMFRQRGHHYLDDMESAYVKKGEKVFRMLPDTSRFYTLTWKRVARDCFHAIYPCVLDKFWVQCAKMSYCDGSLRKRINCAAAGQATTINLFKLWDDLKLIATPVMAQFQDAAEEIDEQYKKLKNERWKGSVNATYYNASPDAIEPAVGGKIYAIAKAVADELRIDVEILKSNALQRIGKQGELSGKVGGVALATIWGDRRAAAQLMMPRRQVAGQLQQQQQQQQLEQQPAQPGQRAQPALPPLAAGRAAPAPRAGPAP
jgi:hypothetical protein